MGHYPDGPPPHSHRTPAEIAEDELLEAIGGNVCMPVHPKESVEGNEILRHAHVALLPWADAHPLEAVATARPATKRARTPEPTAAVSAFRHLFRPNNSFKLLLAIENDDNARIAIRVADALTGRGAVPGVISATELVLPGAGTPDSMALNAGTSLGEDFHYNRRRSLQDLIASTTGSDRDWPITSVIGDAAECIVDEAVAKHSDLIVMGMHYHGAFEQAIGENTATRVMGRAPVPVLGVRPSLSSLPRRIMVATDFGDASREAAHLAANLADPDGTVILVHVTIPSAVVEEGDEGAALIQREGIEHAFIHLSEEISEGKSIRVETVCRNGDAGKELMAAAQLISPDVIAIASQRHHLVTRLLLGSVTRTLGRKGRWPMLITPPLNHRPV